MILGEARRYFRSHPWLSFSAICVLTLGMAASVLALALLLAFSSLVSPGMRSLGYATVAEATGAGAIIPMPWNSFENLRDSSLPPVKFAAYSRPFRATLRARRGR